MMSIVLPALKRRIKRRELHKPPTMAPGDVREPTTESARTLAVSLSGSTRCQPGPTENCFAAQCERIGSGRTLRVILPILQNLVRRDDAEFVMTPRLDDTG